MVPGIHFSLHATGSIGGRGGGYYIDTSKLTNTLLQKLFFAGSRTVLSQFGQFRVLCMRFLIIITFLYYPYERMTAVADTLTTK